MSGKYVTFEIRLYVNTLISRKKDIYRLYEISKYNPVSKKGSSTSEKDNRLQQAICTFSSKLLM